MIFRGKNGSIFDLQYYILGIITFNPDICWIKALVIRLTYSSHIEKYYDLLIIRLPQHIV
jgi:hypothetical protein